MNSSLLRPWTMDVITTWTLCLITLISRCIAVVGGTPFSQSCPVGRYTHTDGRCLLCYAYCGPRGCTGPSNRLGVGGCSSCYLARFSILGPGLECISRHSGCQTNHYMSLAESDPQRDIRSRAICRPCHLECRSCVGPRQNQCILCRHFRLEEFCVEECPGGSVINYRLRTCYFISDFTRDRIMSRYRQP